MPNHYLYQELLTLLDYKVTPTQYVQIVKQYTTRNGTLRPFNIGEDYWEMLTTYTFARCPFCGKVYQQPADTYSLLGWSGFTVGLSKGYYDSPSITEPPCPHLFATQQFLNLHNHLPFERSYISCDSGETPYLTDWFFPDDLATRVILHALPICRIVDEQFVPSYTVFSLTYFSEDEAQLRQRHFAWQREEGKGDSEYYPAGFVFPSESPSANNAYDLVVWAQRGQLGYIDHTTPGFPLKIGSAAALPAIFQKIEGRRCDYSWRDGTFAFNQLRGLPYKP